MKIINVEVKNKIAISPDAEIVCGNSDYRIVFSFDAEWDNENIKTAHFKWNGKTRDVVFNGNEVDVPAVKGTTKLEIGVFAGDIRTTTSAMIKCRKSCLCDNGVPDEPSEDVYNQIVSLCEEAIETANSVEERANNGEFVGEKGEKGDPTEVSQTTGDSDTAVMSQKATTNEFKKVTSRLSNLERATKDVLYYDQTHKFTSGESFQFADALPYGRLDGIEGYHEYIRHRNLIPVPYPHVYGDTVAGVDFYTAEDYRIILNGKANAEKVLWFVGTSANWCVEPNVYYLSGCPKNTNGLYIKLTAKDSDGNTVYQRLDYGDGVKCDLRNIDYAVLALGIFMPKGYQFNNTEYKPQFELGDTKSEFEGAGEFICEAPPTSIKMSNGGGTFYEFAISDELLEYLESKQLGYGLSGNYINIAGRNFIQYTKPIYTNGKLTGAYPTRTTGTSYNISKYLDNSSRYMNLSASYNKVQLFSKDGKLLRNSKGRVLMQHKITDTSEEV